MLVFDEAHRIAGWDQPVQLELREVLRNDRRFGVVIASSEASALEALTAAGGPLHLVGQRVPLPRIAGEDWRSGLRGRFAAAGSPLDDDALELLLAESRGHPFCTMWPARESARIAEPLGAMSAASVEAALTVVRADPAAWGLRDAA